MSYIKNQEEIKYILEGGKILGEVLEKISKMAIPGASAFDIDQTAEKLIKEAGGRPAFKNYSGGRGMPAFPYTICASANDEVVHGFASKSKILKDGDIFGIDIGMQWPVNSGLGEKGNGFYTDTALTVPVGAISEKAKQLLTVTRKALERAIKIATINNTVADIGKTVQDYVEPQGFAVVRDLVGHGVGHKVHEEPRVPNFYDDELEKWKLEPGVVIAIEPMVNTGTYHIEVAEDDWTIKTRDGGLSAHFEHTIIITKDGPVVATRRPSELV